jgi:biopolymer transport protein ExbD
VPKPTAPNAPKFDEEIKLPMTSMIDVTFLLLIFFLVVSRFSTLEGKLSAYLPATEENGNGPIEKVEVLLRVIEEGQRMDPFDEEKAWSEEPGTRFVYDDSRVIEYSIGPRTTRDLDLLRERLEQLHRFDRERPMNIDARKGIVYDEVIEVFDAAAEAGYERVYFIGSYE